MKNYYVSNLCEERIVVNGKEVCKPILITCRSIDAAEHESARLPFRTGSRFAYVLTADRARRLTCVEAFDNYPGARKATRTVTSPKIGKTLWSIKDFMKVQHEKLIADRRLDSEAAACFSAPDMPEGSIIVAESDTYEESHV